MDIFVRQQQFHLLFQLPYQNYRFFSAYCILIQVLLRQKTNLLSEKGIKYHHSDRPQLCLPRIREFTAFSILEQPHCEQFIDLSELPNREILSEGEGQHPSKRSLVEANSLILLNKNVVVSVESTIRRLHQLKNEPLNHNRQAISLFDRLQIVDFVHEGPSYNEVTIRSCQTDLFEPMALQKQIAQEEQFLIISGTNSLLQVFMLLLEVGNASRILFSRNSLHIKAKWTVRNTCIIQHLMIYKLEYRDNNIQIKIIVYQKNISKESVSWTTVILIKYSNNNPIKSTMAQFGKSRLADFYVDPTYINLNHASYGYVPKLVLEQKQRWTQRCEFNTQKWFRFDAQDLIAQTRAFIAKKINCSLQNIFIVENATDGINSILKSLTWNEGDVVLIPNTAYSCVRQTVNYLRDRYKITIFDIAFTREDLKSPENMQLKVENQVNAYPKKIKCAVFDHIISVPAIICPIETLQQFFSEKGIPLFVDGAHAINQVEVNMAQIKPAAYFSNFHKWSYTPKNAAFLYISDKFLSTIRPVLTGNFYGQGPSKQFFWTGTRDYSSYLCIPKAFEYSDSFGPNQVRSYNHSLVLAAAKRISQIWKTTLFTEDQRCVGYMSNVQVPCSSITTAVAIAHEMLQADNCFPIFYEFDGKIWIRISAQIYNVIGDYQFMANKFLSYLAKHAKEMK